MCAGDHPLLMLRLFTPMETALPCHRVQFVHKMLHCPVKTVKIYLAEEILCFRAGERISRH